MPHALSSFLRRRGFVSEFKSLLSELEQYACDAEMLSVAAESLNSEGHKAFFDKLCDIALIYSEYKKEINKNFTTYEELLGILDERLQDSDFLKSSYVFFDGFTGFTVSQYKIIETIIKRAEYVCLSLSYEGEKLHPEAAHAASGNLFFMTDNCIEKIKTLAGNKASDITFTFTDKEIKGKTNAPELEFLRHKFFVNPVTGRKQERFEEEISAIEIFEADDIKEEMSLVIDKIKYLIAREGYRYKDIAVVMEDIESYGDMSYKLMKQGNIPAFLDRTEDVSADPFIESMRALLKIVTAGFTYENIFRYIKTGFSPVPLADIDELDNYCLATGIKNEAKWKAKWTRIPGRLKVNEAGEYESYYDLDKLNEIRKSLYEHISAFKKDFNAAKKVNEKTAVIESVLNGEHTAERINELFCTPLGEELRQVIVRTAELFDDTRSLFGEEKLSSEEYADMLDAAFEEMSAGFIPPVNDCVIIGDTDRTRLSNIRALFVVGVNDGVIPKKSSPHGILNDADIMRLEAQSISLAPSSKELAFTNKFYLYLLLTKPFDKLYLSYCRKDIQGDSLKESYLIKDMLAAFNKLKVTPVSEKDTRISIASLKESNASGNIMLSDITLAPSGVELLYGGEVEGSITSFEKYAGCPFSFFLSKGLKIYPRDRYEFTPADFGTVVHDILYRILQGCIKNNILIHELSDSDRLGLVEKQLKSAEKEYYILSDNERNKFIRYSIKKMAASTLKAVGIQLAGGKFSPFAFEKRFSEELDVKGGSLKFGGTIDRSDISVNGENVYLRIVDYKTGNTEFDLTKFYHGRNLQLVSYLSAAEKEITELYPGKNIIPAALCYMKASDPVAPEDRKLLTGEEIDDYITGEYRMKGIVADDAMSVIVNDAEGSSKVIEELKFNDGKLKKSSNLIPIKKIRLLQEYNRDKLCDIAGEILGGKADVSPLADRVSSSGFLPCEYCEYRQVCNFSEETGKMRVMKSMKSDDVWALIGEGRDVD